MTEETKTCGDNGGVKKNGEPCGMVFVDPVTGRCKSHPAENFTYDATGRIRPTSPTDAQAPDRSPDLEEENRRLRRELAEAEARAEQYNPSHDATNRMFMNGDDVVEFYGADQMREIAQATLADLNRNRMRRGFDRIEWSDAEYEEEIRKVAEQMAAERRNLVPGTGNLNRVLKFYNPNSGDLVQIPIEDQVNNHKGSLEDSMARYRRKGFKLATMRCRRNEAGELVPDRNGNIVTRPCGTRNCWDPAEVDANGHDSLDGYCTPDHRNRTEAGKESAGGVTTRQMLNA